MCVCPKTEYNVSMVMNLSFIISENLKSCLTYGIEDFYIEIKSDFYGLIMSLIDYILYFLV